jgi:hypothetical protein
LLGVAALGIAADVAAQQGASVALVPVSAVGAVGSFTVQIAGPLVAQPPYIFAVPPIFYSALVPPVTYAAIVPPIFYTAVPYWGGPMPQAFPPVIAGVQIATPGLDFGQMLPTGETLVDTPTVTITVLYGPDTDPAARLGTPVIGTIPANRNGTGLANTSVLVKFDATGAPTSAATQYLLVFSCEASDGTNLPAWEMTIIAQPPG